MPQTVTIDLPLIISPRGGITLVRPIGLPDLSLAAGSEAAAVRAVRRRILKRCSGMIGSELVHSMVRGKACGRLIRVTIAPEKKSDAWREPVHVEFDLFVWQQGESIVIAYVPPLDLTVVATPQTDLEKLVQEQVRSAIRRRGIWSLVGLARIDQTNGMSLVQQRIEIRTPTPAERARDRDDKPKTKTPTLNSVATRLLRRSLPEAFDRDREVEQLAQLLAAEPSRSVLLVGPSGVGKTAIFHQWVRRRGEFGVDSAIKNVACWATDGSRLISGQCGFGMWQRQCLEMAAEARRYPSVVHLGNLVELSESGRLRGSGGCGALLAPRLADGSLKAVIECTAEQLTRISRVEPHLVQALTVLRIEEPTPDQTRSILLEAAANWRPVNVTEELKRKKRRNRRAAPPRRARPAPLPVVQPEALQVLDRLHRRFRTDAAAPGRPLAFFHAVMSELGPQQTLDVQTVIEAFGRQTGLPGFLIDDSVRPDLDSIEQQLKSQVIGQDAVIETLVDMIATLGADLSRGDRPLASMMLIGPTGVGKTETAKALARLIYSDVSRLVRIDMSELSTPSAVGRLIGDALHPEGLLTSAVRAQPFSLVLLDEFEKAHPSVFDLLLQVLGEGRLTDGRGRLADFRNSIVLMTSNLGVDTFRAVPLGLADTQRRQRYQNHFQRQVRDFLRPEMFNRIDRILTYDPLDQTTVEQIAQLRLAELRRRDGWQSTGDRFDVEPCAVERLTRRGYQPQYGARPLTREVERSIVVPLAEAICDTGRVRKLDAVVTAAESAAESDRQPSRRGPRPDAADELHVKLTPHPLHEKRSDENLVTLIDEVTTLRRRGQALDRCDAMRRLRNQYTMVSRKLKTLLRRARTAEQREKIKFGPLGLDRMQTRQRLKSVSRLREQIDQAESRLLSDYYRGARIDRDEVAVEAEDLREQLWKTLCELLGETTGAQTRITLVMTGPNLDQSGPLLNAYRRLANVRNWNLQIHALLRRRKQTNRAGEWPGWSEQPAFRIATSRERIEEVVEQWVATERDGPSLVAHRLIRFDALTNLPRGTLGLMMTFRGQDAALMMGGEEGVHTFKRFGQRQSTGHSLLISTHRAMPIEYVAPDWLPRGDFELSGFPRRAYDVENQVVQDLTLDDRIVKMDREGKWIESLIQQELERRIWAELDDSDESTGGESAGDTPGNQFVITN